MPWGPDHPTGRRSAAPTPRPVSHRSPPICHASASECTLNAPLLTVTVMPIEGNFFNVAPFEMLRSGQFFLCMEPLMWKWFDCCLVLKMEPCVFTVRDASHSVHVTAFDASNNLDLLLPNPSGWVGQLPTTKT